MKIYLIAGEDSGDLHASHLVAALKARHPGLEFRGVGGDKMQQQGTELIAHVRHINFMGFVEVLRHLGKIRALFRQVRADIAEWKPDLVVLVDYPGFNIRLLPYIKSLGIKVLYYISPQVWAWKKGRVKTLRKYVDRMAVILPFEKDFYAAEGMKVDFVGHPLLDVIPPSAPQKPESHIVALLPGSRKQEIRTLLPLMLELRERFPDYRFVIAGAPSQPESFYRDICGDAPVELWQNRTYELLSQADYAITASGTATLETALWQVPEVVVYKGSAISYAIGKRLVKVPFISLVNLILGRRAVDELIQRDCTVNNMQSALRQLIDPGVKARILADYQELRTKLGDAGASVRAAGIVGEMVFKHVERT